VVVHFPILHLEREPGQRNGVWRPTTGFLCYVYRAVDFQNLVSADGKELRSLVAAPLAVFRLYSSKYRMLSCDATFIKRKE
jgi:hypothetical protein